MNEAEFTKEYRRIINQIAEDIEMADPDGDIEIDLNADLLSFTNKSGIYVINKQSSVSEIWLSSPLSGPHHFSNKGDKWLTSSDVDLVELLQKELYIVIKLN